MYLKQIVDSLSHTYKKIDIRLVIIRNQNISEIAFLKILFSKEENLNQKDLSFFNSFSHVLQFIRKILDISDVGTLIQNLQNGILKLEGNSYALSARESDFLNENLDLSLMYSKWVSDLYIKDGGLDIFPLLPIRALFSKTCSGILSSYDIPSKVKGFET